MNKDTPLWSPSQELMEKSNISGFTKYINEKYGLDIRDYASLYEWSVMYPVNFWQSLCLYFKMPFINSSHTVLEQKDTSRSNEDIRNYRWFGDVKMNFAEALLNYRDEKAAIIFLDEQGRREELSYQELNARVASAARGLRDLGVTKGDRIAALITNIPEAIIAMLATTSIGAIWSSTSPDFGLQGVVDRFSQIEPKVLIGIDAYYYNGKMHDVTGIIEKVAEKIPSIKSTLIVHRESEATASGKFISWQQLMDNHSDGIEFEQVAFDHPVYIMYSSGTTGVPKCIVHGGGGTLLQHVKELYLHTNVQRQDKVMYFTTTGWMMWNWMVSTLAIGATVVLYDGSPSYPSLNALWEAIQREGITVFGTSPKFLSACRNNDIEPARDFELSSLKIVLSTGAPLVDENYRWVYEHVKRDVQLSSISGGTDIISCFMLGSPILPVYSEELQCRGLGMKVEAFDEEGKPVIGEKGELVCSLPFPSMPVYFWNDTDGKKYDEAYFTRYAGAWQHGDYIIINERGGVKVLGRSDATLNPGGIRIGTAEIYRVVEAIDGIADSLVTSIFRDGEEKVVLFVVTQGDELSEELETSIRSMIKSELTPRHVPHFIRHVREVPHTRNGKKTEIAVKKAISGEHVENRASLANPASLDEYESMRF